ncbi:RNA pyrophosphohydrolase [Parasphingorhabdus cellanae]|uniref:RNA pyrophosphohydrolase n=1 Tax=Parasphingorhabdus cellanae TaxID=2806553 RepID=A0ABX7T5D5_9SPHN|nr:RNA pyrophosphohydrolase [Parasphingorhabdus cellanae]QTD55972.1 RNA pyrophosphohydrolase [Parasphingorhabdus cellanae]
MTDFSDLPYRPCAGIMLADKNGKIFVGQRLDAKDSAYPDAWQMPQGGIDDGEESEAAAIRELEEETGITAAHVEIIARSAEEYYYDLPDELLGKIWKGKYRGQRQSWFLMRFTGEDRHVNIATEHAEFSDWKWAKPSDLPDMIVPFKKDLYRAILKEFDPLI